jgi:hypothetical protein
MWKESKSSPGSRPAEWLTLRFQVLLLTSEEMPETAVACVRRLRDTSQS